MKSGYALMPPRVMCYFNLPYIAVPLLLFFLPPAPYLCNASVVWNNIKANPNFQI